jgi:hypothetical protein
MVRVPQFGGNEKVFPLHNAFIYGSLDSLSDFFFIAIIGRTVE